MLRQSRRIWVCCKGLFSSRLVGATAILIGVLGTTATVWSQAAPAKLPDGALSGIIVPVESDPAVPTKIQPEEPEQAEQSEQAKQPAPPASLAPDLLPQNMTRVKAIVPADVRPSSFQGLVPGTAKRSFATEKLGEPTHEETTGDHTVMTFKIGPFPSVDVTLRDDMVTSILVHLAAAGSRDDVVKELKLSGFRSTPVVDESGQILGEVYPERALTLVYAPEQTPTGVRLVSDVVLEKITPEPFLLRAQQNVETRLGSCLSDLEMVHQLAPDNAMAYSIESDIHAQCGRVDAAIAVARQAIELDPSRIRYQIAMAELQRRKSQFDVAIQVPRKILESTELSPLDEALTHLELGKVLVTMPSHAYKEAMEEFVASVKQLSALAKEADSDPARKHARELLIDAELWLARTIASGPWEKRSEVAPQWLASAEKTTRQLIQEDHGPQDRLLHVYVTSLECLDILDGEGDPAKLADAAITLGRSLITESKDEDSQATVEWHLGIALRHAAEIAYRHGQADTALRYAGNANALLTSGAKRRAGAPETSFQLAQIYFLTGSIYAVSKNDHESAVTWYDKAVPELKNPLPPLLQDVRGKIGDQFVSIGVSFWQEKRREDALAVTEQGADRLRQAVETGERSKRALIVPLANLADMHKAMGHKDEARELSEMAASLAPKKVKRTIR